MLKNKRENGRESWVSCIYNYRKVLVHKAADVVEIPLTFFFSVSYGNVLGYKSADVMTLKKIQTPFFFLPHDGTIVP